MKLALILSNFGERMQVLQRNLAGDFSVIVGRSLAESMDLLQTLPVDVALVDLESCQGDGDEIAERAREYRSQCAVVAILPRDGAGDGPAMAYDAALRVDSSSYEIEATLERVMERQRLLDEMEQQRAEIRRLQARSERLQAARAPAQPVDKLIKAFSRALSSGFDLERLLGLFADTVLEMMRVSKVSVLLREGEPGEYRVRCFRGLRPDVAEGLRLRSGAGLAAWLAREGRIMTLDLAEGPGLSVEVRKEMDALQAVVSIPLLCSGMLAGILNLNSRVTGSPFQEDELETLFTLSGHMAVAVQEMGVFRQMLYEKAHGEQILAHMSAGVVAIDEGQRVVTCNHRAAEIVGRAPEDVLQHDLRRLPSPLGDMLYETLATSRRYEAEEVLLMPGRVPVVVDTCRLHGPDGGVLGSVAVLSPVRAPRGDAASRYTDFAAGLCRSVGHLSAQLDRPLARIEALAQALAAAGEDADGRAKAAGAVQHEVQVLRALAQKLAAPGEGLRYRFEAAEASSLVAQAVKQAQDGAAEAAVVAQDLEDVTARVKADVQPLVQALSGLMRHAAAEAAPDSSVQVSVSEENRDAGHALSPNVLIRIGCRRRRPAGAGAKPEPAVGGEERAELGPDLMLGQRIIEDHGGTLEHARDSGLGIHLEVRLPVLGGVAGLQAVEARPVGLARAG